MTSETLLSWGLRRLRIDACWREGWTGAGVRVGHLDTGVDAAHPALTGRVAAFAEFDAEGAMVADARQHDTASHGTHTSGLICGGAASGQAVGVAPGARLCSGVVIEGGHVLARVLSGIDWMFDCGVRVVCLSLGIPGYHPLFEIALARLRQRGVLVVCPIGNGGRGTACSPALYPGVLAIGATDREDRVARFSGDGSLRRDIGARPSLVAPGAGVPSSEPGGRMGIRDGTSMAAAYVAGVAALLFQARPDASVDEVERALLDSAERLVGAPPERQGRGLVNPLGALQLLLTGAMEPCLHHRESIRG
jgi:subtilisin family serine protease